MTDIGADAAHPSRLHRSRRGRGGRRLRADPQTGRRSRATSATPSPAADTSPALLVFGAVVVVAGPAGDRRIPLDAFFIRSGVTTLASGSSSSAIELPLPASRADPARAAHASPRARPGVGHACLLGLRGRRDAHRVWHRSARGRSCASTRRACSRTPGAGDGQARTARGDVRRGESVTHSLRAGPDYRLRCSGSSALRAIAGGERPAATRMSPPSTSSSPSTAGLERVEVERRTTRSSTSSGMTSP
jgi:hypothetical protein